MSIGGLKIEGLSPVVNAIDGESRSRLPSRNLQGQEAPFGANQASSNGSVGGVTDSFSSMLEKSINRVNEMQVQADEAIKHLVAGRTKNIHETMLSIERADLSMKLMMQVRNKVIDAYREVMRMQV